MLISSVVHIVFGILILINPLETLAAITTIGGIVLLLTEIGNIGESLYMLIKTK